MVMATATQIAAQEQLVILAEVKLTDNIALRKGTQVADQSDLSTKQTALETLILSRTTALGENPPDADAAING